MHVNKAYIGNVSKYVQIAAKYPLPPNAVNFAMTLIFIEAYDRFTACKVKVL